MSVHPLRAASLTAAAVVAASLTVLAAPAANAAPPVGDTTLSGVATVDGTPVAGIDVDLYEGTAPYKQIGSTETDADGAYYFDFTNGTTNGTGGFVSTASTATSYKLRYVDLRQLSGDQLRAQDEYFNDRYTVQGALPVAKPATGTNAAVPTVTLASTSGLKGTPAVAAPAGYYYHGGVNVYDADGNFVTGALFDNDPSTAARTESYTIKGLNPGEHYYAQFAATATNPTTNDQINYVTTWYTDSRSASGATPITAAASGQYVQGVQITLSNTFAPKEAPSIVGQVAFGKTVTADPGDWGYMANNHFAYTWYLNGAPVATGPSYAIAKSAKGAKLQLSVTNENDTQFFLGDSSVIGTAASKVAKVGYPIKFKAHAKKAVVKGRTVVKVTGSLKVKHAGKKAAKLAKGKVTVFETGVDGELVKVGKGHVRRGKLTLNLKGVVAGKHVYEVDFDGGKKIASDSDTVKVKV